MINPKIKRIIESLKQEFEIHEGDTILSWVLSENTKGSRELDDRVSSILSDELNDKNATLKANDYDCMLTCSSCGDGAPYYLVEEFKDANFCPSCGVELDKDNAIEHTERSIKQHEYEKLLKEDPLKNRSKLSECIEFIARYSPCDHSEYLSVGTNDNFGACGKCGAVFSLREHETIKMNTMKFNDSIKMLKDHD